MPSTKYKHFAKIGDMSSILSEQSPGKDYVEMEGPSSTFSGEVQIASADGTWVTVEMDTDVNEQTCEYVAKYYSIAEQLRIMNMGTPNERDALKKIYVKKHAELSEK